MSLILRLAALLALLLPGAQAQAAPECDASISLVNFGEVDLRRGGEITGRLRVSCQRPTPFVLSLSPGLGDFRMRRMRGPRGSELRYNLFVDAAHRRVWGDGVTAGTARLKGMADGRKTTFITVYGRVPGGQTAPPGNYTDALTIAFEP